MARRPRRPPSYAPIRYPNLAAYIEATGDQQKHIAAVVKTSQAHISRIVNGRAIPRPPLAVRIARYAHIPLDSFTRVYLATNSGTDALEQAV